MTCTACSPLKCQASGCECECHDDWLLKEQKLSYELHKVINKRLNEIADIYCCPKCKKLMKQVRDSRSGTFTGHLFRCDTCMPKNKVVSIG